MGASNRTWRNVRRSRLKKQLDSPVPLVREKELAHGGWPPVVDSAQPSLMCTVPNGEAQPDGELTRPPCAIAAVPIHSPCRGEASSRAVAAGPSAGRLCAMPRIGERGRRRTDMTPARSVRPKTSHPVRTREMARGCNRRSGKEQVMGGLQGRDGQLLYD